MSASAVESVSEVGKKEHGASPGGRRSLIFINRFFHPDHSATSQIVSDLAFSLAAHGEPVQVITSRGLYDKPEAQLPIHEIVNDVEIHRVATPRFGRNSLVGRAIDYLNMYWAFATAAARIARPGDILIAKTDPPLLSVPISLVARAKRLHLINWLQDLYPEVAIQLGVDALRPVAPLLTWARNASLRAADVNVAIGELMAKRIERAGVSRDRIAVVVNWCDDEKIDPQLHYNNPLRREWGLEGKFVVGYSGNLGRAHEYQTMLGAAEILRGRTDIVFLFIGGGHLSGPMKDAIEARGLAEKFLFRPYQPPHLLPQSLTIPDIHWLSLTPAMEGLIVPSKLYGILAAGRPTIAVTDRDGEVARTVLKSDCGLHALPGDSPALADAIAALADSAQTTARMGGNARKLLDSNFSRERAFELWRRVIVAVDGFSR